MEYLVSEEELKKLMTPYDTYPDAYIKHFLKKKQPVEVIANGKVIDAQNPIFKEGYLEHQLASVRLAEALAENIGKEVEIFIREVAK